LAWPGMTKQASSAGVLAPPAGRGAGKHRRPRKHAAPVARRSAAGAGTANERFAAELTVIIPAYNEAASLADTVKSLVNQTTPPARVVAVDDCSTDGTGEVAAALGVEVLRPPANTGSKAGAQTFALRTVSTRYVMAIDADTILATDAIEELSAAFTDPGVAAACGLVLPLLAIFVNAWYALGLVVDFPVVAIPVLVGAWYRAETSRAVTSLPCYFALRLANCWFMLRAVVDEARGRRLAVYEKGH